ncbi:DUF732 domain-containing protein [Mycolicibacterium neoaurum]|uniref:DUF732 domain-containing protein n=1 Tax=Mycolicibacterium neoaurum TaxID=1795 RepID=UPI001421E447|nr:DUF732 domain-containing protein [Mycolicibacterium neoaurum]
MTTDPAATVTVIPPSTVTVTKDAPVPRQVNSPGPVSSDGLPPAPTFLPELVAFDDQFMATLQRNGFVVYDRAMGLKQAHATCAMLRNGEPSDLVSQKFLGVNPEITWQMATQFVGTVRGVYPGCFPR